MTNVYAVLTHQPLSEIIETGVIGDFGADKKRVEHTPYIVCVRNTSWGIASKDVPHKTAFIIGKVDDVMTSNSKTARGSERITVRISEYAVINIPNAWSESRNPVAFTSVENLGINLNALDWKHIVAVHNIPYPEPSTDFSVIESAKEIISSDLGIPVDRIDISIRF